MSHLRRHGSRPESIRRPRITRIAGSTVIAATIAITTAAMPPYPMLLRKTWGNTSRLDIDAATTSPENITVRPAVASVRATACRGLAGSSGGSSASSSRNRLTMKRE
jgi:hypothetical protein